MSVTVYLHIRVNVIHSLLLFFLFYILLHQFGHFNPWINTFSSNKTSAFSECLSESIYFDLCGFTSWFVAPADQFYSSTNVFNGRICWAFYRPKQNRRRGKNSKRSTLTAQINFWNPAVIRISSRLLSFFWLFWHFLWIAPQIPQ